MDKEKLLREFLKITHKHNPSYDIIMEVCMFLMIKMFYESNLDEHLRRALYEEIETSLQKFKELKDLHGQK